LARVDSEGIELPNLETARRVAIKRIRALLNSEAGSGPLNLDRTVEITNVDGDVLSLVTFREAARFQEPSTPLMTLPE
jgi:hypothetical protein